MHFRRLPSATLAAMFAFGCLTLVAQPPATPGGLNDLRSPQQRNSELFVRFEQELSALADKLDRSDRPEERERAKVIRSALDFSRKQDARTQFNKMIESMAKSGGLSQELDSIAGKDKQLQKTLQDILNLLLTDDAATQRKNEIDRLEKLLAEARAILRNQKNVRAMTDLPKVDKDRLTKDQNKLTEQTKDLAGKIDPKGKDDKPTPGREQGIAKAENKPEAKPGERAGETKPEPKDDEPGKPGDDTEPGETKPGDAKPGDMKPGESKPGDMKPGDAKPGEAKPGDMKPGDPKAGDAKPTDGANKPAPPKPPTDNKRGQEKPGDPKAGDPKGTNAGPMPPPPQGNAKPDSGSPPMGGQPPAGSPPPNSGSEPKDQPPGRKQVQEAIPHQQNAEKELDKNNRDQAGKKQDKAIEELTKAVQEMEKRLKQMREEELLKLLADLESRINRMISMQSEVYEATKLIDGIFLKAAGSKDTEGTKKSQNLGTKELEIIAEAEKTLKLLESEGTAVAFARVLEEVRIDMVAVQRRLEQAYVGKDTQLIEENILAMLKEMAAALKKSQQDKKDEQQKPPEEQSPQKPGDKKLLEQISELKLIRALQMQVNGRTKVSGEQYKGESAADPLIQAELRDLAARQAKLQDMLAKIASGAND